MLAERAAGLKNQNDVLSNNNAVLNNTNFALNNTNFALNNTNTALEVQILGVQIACGVLGALLLIAIILIIIILLICFAVLSKRSNVSYLMFIINKTSKS